MSVESPSFQSVDTGFEAPTPAAYLISCTLQNVRCFGPSQRIDLSDGNGRPARWTVILGDNGVGKTTVLQCLARSAGSRPVRAIRQTEDGGDGQTERWIPDLMNDESLKGNIRRYKNLSLMDVIDSDRDLLTELATALIEGQPNTGDYTVVDYNWSVGEPINLAVPPTATARYIALLSNDVALSFANTMDILPDIVCYAYGATRRMSVAALSDARDSSASASLFSEDVTLVNAEEWLLQADYAALAESPSQVDARRKRDQIKDVLIELLPDVTDIRFVRPTEASLTPRIEVSTPYGWVGFRDLSLGYRTLVTWIVDLAYRLFERYPQSSNPLAEPAIVLVDEIDLHLHPKWQRSLIGYLTERFPNTQFIVSAHSPLIVQAASEANIVLLRRVDDHVVVENEIEAIRGWRIDQILTSDLFGLASARPPKFDSLLEERQTLLSKPSLSVADEERLSELEGEMDELPIGETSDDIKAMDLIRRIAQLERGR